ncbi:MAG TPA: hypothetical protein VGP94_16600 [Tepidisphaeraceae bacterium]|jgi:hypothetical protein|nr:hypothetical protein [Tepidisphaeraceae bacterium]
MIAVITRAFQISNYIEAGLWICIGLGFAIVAIRRKGVAYTGSGRAQCRAAALHFILFGISDIVEAHTGAWYKPTWLLVWKSACVVGLTTLLLIYFWKRRANH